MFTGERSAGSEIPQYRDASHSLQLLGWDEVRSCTGRISPPYGRNPPWNAYGYPFFSIACDVAFSMQLPNQERVFMKPLFAGMIFVVTALIAFSEVAPSVDGRPALERAVHDLIVDLHLR